MSTKVFALGGIGEIGKNCYVIEDNDELFIIDCGVKFADQDVLHGINGIIPPFDYLIENKNKIKGLIVTHAHEDHIGGIPYLLKVITGLKIYAAKFTCAMIKGKISQHSDINSPTFEIIDDK
jgi:ribonuclease J